ncbi:MAG TPA: FdrA family protein [Streptosporangiaceae bacterium]|nr:FdrA family protein [Streptosporangiaceae bacterium]
MSAEHVEARPGAYADSVALMSISADVRRADGVHAALIAMATELNLGLLPAMGFRPPAGAGPNHLLIAIRATGQAALSSALAAVDAALTARPAAEPGALAAAALPRTVGAAVRASGPGLALISVPGPYAFAEAMDALDAGCDVMIFSDNVPVEQEILLKDIAAQRDLLVMGPDCGTAIVGGVGLGFAHTLAAGPIGLVAASGTGAQQVACLLDYAGTGVSAVLGVGGRDLSAAVGGRSARAALTALDDDPGTDFIIVVSKPPDPDVAAGLRDYALTLATPVQFAFVGTGRPDLTAATEAALRAIGQPVPAWPRWPGPSVATPSVAVGSGEPRAGEPRAGEPRAGALRGLFAGGTLCVEAMVIAAERLGPIRSNVPLRPELRLSPLGPVPGTTGPGTTGPGKTGPGSTATGHAMIDFGDDELTAGRAHPMIDQSLRIERLAIEAADPAVAVILLDVVLGHGAHPDPAAELGPAIAAGRERGGAAFVVSLIGARSDPQGLEAQASALQAAGAHVFGSNAAAARFAVDLVARS